MEVLILIVALVCIHYIIPSKYLMKYYILSATLLGLLAYFYYPTPNQDLYHHFNMLIEFRTNGWKFVTRTHYFQLQPTFATYSFLISLLNNNGFLPAITVTISYLLSFRLNWLMKQKYLVSRAIINLNFLFLLSTLSYLSVMGGIRNMLALSVFSFALYYDLVENKRKVFSFLIYGFMLFMHSSTIILLIIRIILLFKNKYMYFLTGIVFLVWMSISGVVLNLLNIFTNLSYFSTLVNQINSYLAGGTQYVYSTAFVKSASLVLILIIILIGRPNIWSSKNNFRTYLIFNLLLICFIVGSVLQYDIFVRSIAFLIFSSPVIIGMIYAPKLNYEKTLSLNNKKRQDIRLKYLLVILIIFVSVGSIWFNTWSEYTKIIFRIF